MSLSKYDFLLHQKMFKFAKHMRTTFPYAPCSNLRVGSNTSNPVVLVLCNTWIEMQISSRKWLNTHNRAPYVIPLQLHEDWTIRKKRSSWMCFRFGSVVLHCVLLLVWLQHIVCLHTCTVSDIIAQSSRDAVRCHRLFLSHCAKRNVTH